MNKALYFALVAGALSVTASSAAVISTTGSFTNTINPSLSSGAFWDNRSQDGNFGSPLRGCNAGYYAVGQLPLGTTGPGAQPNCSNMLPGTKPNQGGFVGGKYLGSGTNGRNPADFLFDTAGITRNSGGYKIDFSGAITTTASQIGYFTINQNGSRNLFPLFTNSGNPNGPTDFGKIGTSAYIKPGSNFGFYIKNNIAGPNTVYYSDQGFTTFNVDSNHMVLFRGTTQNQFGYNYMVGFEDSPTARPLFTSRGGRYDADYNDYMIKLQQVPEPGTYGMLGLGLTGLIAAVRRRRKA